MQTGFIVQTIHSSCVGQIREVHMNQFSYVVGDHDEKYISCSPICAQAKIDKPQDATGHKYPSQTHEISKLNFLTLQGSDVSSDLHNV